MNLKENYALTNNFLKEKKLTDPILQSIVFMGFMYGLSKEEICVCVFPDEGQPLSYMHCDYMRRALENGAALDEVKKVRDMTPEEAKAYLHEVSSRQEWVALKKLNERLKKMEEDNENLKSELTSTMTKYEKDREELVILRGEKKVLEKKISDTAMSLEEHQKEIESLRMQAEDMEMKYKNKITTMQKELREAKDREVESKEKTTDLESQIRIAEDKHREEVRNLVRERYVFQKELEKRKRRIIFHRKKGEKEKQRFFELVVSGKLSAEQTSQLVNGLKESIPLEVLLTVARPENSAALMEQMMECYKNLLVFEEPESKEDAEYAK